MDEHRNMNIRRTGSRRRKRTRLDIFKETYLPPAIVCVALLMILVFIIGSITRGIQRSIVKKEIAQQASISAQHEKERLDKEAAEISSAASALAYGFDYDGAIALINGFSGNLSEYPELFDKKTEYELAKETLVLWDDPNSILSLSFHVLIEDGQRAFSNQELGDRYNRNFITTAEFRLILQQLYENQYILVSVDDMHAEGGMHLYLPEGKKPLLLTQTNVNYYNYMTDSDGDMLADPNGAGFATKLALDANGNITCQMVDQHGQTVIGAFDMVPILESFIETHPDFSYRGARAVLAVTGYEGIFGYRTNPDAVNYLGEGGYQLEQEDARDVCEKLRGLGYELACYTYGNDAYGSLTEDQIQADIERWNIEVAPILGQTDILVFAQNSDIAPAGEAYAGRKYEILKENGFTKFLGFCNGSESWTYAEADYMRIGRLLLTGSNLRHHALWFEAYLDPEAILDPNRGDIPA